MKLKPNKTNNVKTIGDLTGAQVKIELTPDSNGLQNSAGKVKNQFVDVSTKIESKFEIPPSQSKFLHSENQNNMLSILLHLTSTSLNAKRAIFHDSVPGTPKTSKVSETKKYFVTSARSEVYHTEGCRSLYGKAIEGFVTVEELKSEYPNAKRQCSNC